MSPFGDYNFEVATGFLKNLCMAVSGNRKCWRTRGQVTKVGGYHPAAN